MKVVVVGIGQCGCNLVDTFHALNRYASSIFHRRIEIVTDAFAYNTDKADLEGLKHLVKDKYHRVLIGGFQSGGHGLGKINIIGAEISEKLCSDVATTVKDSRKFKDSDAVIVMASGGGGTGSGAISRIAMELKRRLEKPIYAIVALPFSYEEEGEYKALAVTNTGTCIKTLNDLDPAIDTIFLLDNEKFGKMDVGLKDNFALMNEQMVKPFYDLFTAGEEKGYKHIGGAVVDAGDIIQTLKGFTTIGVGQEEIPMWDFNKKHFRDGFKEIEWVKGALEKAIDNLCVECDLADARKILYLVCAPQRIMTLKIFREISAYLRKKSPKADIRWGDYPRNKRNVTLTLIVSELTRVARLDELYDRTIVLMEKRKQIEEETKKELQQFKDKAKGIPSLIQKS